MAKFFDFSPNILGWSSESISIPYQNPLTGKWTVYIPDFLVIYIDAKGAKHCEMIEVKPAKEAPSFAGKVSAKTKLVQIVNGAKWAAAMQFCLKRGIRFRVATEHELFAFKRKA